MMDAASALPGTAPAARLNWRVTPLGLGAALTLLALALRITDLGTRPLWLDEAFSGWFSNQSYHYLWHVLPTYEAHPPFYYSVLKTWRGLAGEGHAAMRGLSVLFITLTVPVIMAIALEQERQGPSGRPLLRAGIAGFLVACSPMFMVLGQEARPYPMLTFGYALAILALLRLTREFKAGGAGRWTSWLMFGGAAEFTMWSHGLGMLYGTCLALALLGPWLSAPLTRPRLIRGLVTAVLVAAAYAPCLIMMSNRVQDWSTNWLGWQPSMLLQLLVLYTVPVEALTLASAIAALAMALLIKRALQSTWASKGWNSDRAMLLLWLGPPMIAAVISAVFVPVFLARTLSATLVPAYLAIAAAIARTDEARERRMIAAAICITLLPAAMLMAVREPSERWGDVSIYLNSHVKPSDQVWLYPTDSALPLAEAGFRIGSNVRQVPAPFPTLNVKGPIRAGWTAVVSVTPEQARRLASDPSLSNVPVVWLVGRQSGIFDPQNDMPNALGKVRRPGAIEQWGYITVRPYYRR